MRIVHKKTFCEAPPDKQLNKLKNDALVQCFRLLLPVGAMSRQRIEIDSVKSNTLKCCSRGHFHFDH